MCMHIYMHALYSNMHASKHAWFAIKNEDQFMQLLTNFSIINMQVQAVDADEVYMYLHTHVYSINIGN